jgi:mRNA-degrading endonuclease toxin of MazEF toxin-antitoxin module
MVQLGSTVGVELSGSHPCLILSIDMFNNGRLGMAVGIPGTSTESKVSNPLVSWVRVNPPEGGIEKPTVFMAEQILRLDIEGRLAMHSRYMGKVDSHTLMSISRIVVAILGLRSVLTTSS